MNQATKLKELRKELREVVLANPSTLPDWLTSNPKPMTSSKSEQAIATRKTMLDIMYAQFDYMFDHVLEQMASGRTIRQTLKDDPRGYESGRYITWIKQDPERTARYEHAQLLYAEQLASEIIGIADGESSESGTAYPIPSDTSRDKLRIESRKWLMGVYNRKRYGDVKQLNIAGNISVTDALAAANSRLEHLSRVIEGELVDDSEDRENPFDDNDDD